MKLISFVLSLVVLIVSCSQFGDDNQRFVQLADNFINQYLQTYPESATALGDHRYDHRLNDYSLEGIKSEIQLMQSYQDSLATISPENLNQINRIDYKILKHNLEKRLFRLTKLKEYEWNPLRYNIGSALYNLVARDFAPLPDRLKNLAHRLEAVQQVLEEAKKNLVIPPKIHTETAIIQNKGNIALVKEHLNIYIDQVPELQEKLTTIQNKTAAALEAYGRWLAEDLLPRSDGKFRLGDKLFREKLYYTLESDFTKEEILASAESDLAETQFGMYQTALPLYREYFPNAGDPEKKDKKQVIQAVLDRLAEEHPNNETIVAMARKKLQSCTDFVRKKALVTVPEQPLQIIVMPEHERGVAVAYCDAPGALEEKGATFYAISPTPEDWPAKRVLSFFREYNNYMLDNLTIHEAVPGHYLQLMHSNAFKAPTMIRAIFASGIFIEGWATYSEQLMVEAGYVGPQLKMQQLKMRLRLLINAIIDQKIHTENMTEEEAMALMMQEGFQEEGEAAGKWRRACMTSTQLSTYYVGNMEMNDLRRRYETKFGPEINMQEMHDKLLSFGSPAPRYVRELLDL